MTPADQWARIWTVPESRRFQSLWFGVGLVALIPGIGAAFLYLVPPTDDATAMTASFIPYGLPADLIAVIFLGVALVRARRRLAIAVLTLISAILLALQVSWIAPQFIPDPRPVTSPPFTIISLNMKWGGADPVQLRSEAASADLVVLVEVTPQAFGSVRSELGDRFPYTVPSAITSGNQSMILSRYPLTDASPLRSTNQQWTARTTMPGIGSLNVIAAHPCNPQCGGQRWSGEHAALLQRAEQLDNAPEVIAGDFNAIDDHGPMRAMYAHGFVSATDITGAGWMPTFPADIRMMPPLIGIDHILVNSRLTALSVNTFRISGTDHLGLIARLAGS
jgi:endonuclease/exonuclease/phosphatase family metal-dependent hydrolase